MKLLSLILLLDPLIAVTTSKFYDDSWAVIIGINKYQNINILNYAVDDAQDIHDMLIEKFYFPEDNISLLLNEEATYQNIKTSLYEMAEKVGKNDRLIIYFAGHGTQKQLPSGGEKGYLLPVDVDTSKLYLTGIDMNIIKDVSETTNAKHVLYLMDACYGGLMAISRAIDKKTPGYLSMRKRTQGRGRQIITAGGKDEESTERPAWGHSAFAKNLLSGLQDEMADRNPEDGYITANELGIYLRDKVELDSDYAQTPQIQQYGTGEGEFVFTVTPPVIEDVKTDVIAKEKPSTNQTVITMDQFERWMVKNYVQPNHPVSVQKSDIYDGVGEDSAKEWKLMFGDTHHIDTTDIFGKWLRMPGPRLHFNRVDGFGLGLGKTFTRLSPFPYELDMESQYNFSRKKPDYRLYLKRYLWNREFQYLIASRYQESKTYDDWSVYADGIHQWGSSFLFNIDRLDYYLAEGYSLFYKYYNEDGFSIESGYKSEKQYMQSKTTDFSVFQYKKKYRENYFSDEDHFTEGTLSSLNIKLGINGAVPEYNMNDYETNEIIYELDPNDIPLEYELNNYNLINIVSNTLGEPDTSIYDSLALYEEKQGFKIGFSASLGFKDTTTMSDAHRALLRESLAKIDSSYTIKKDRYINYSDSNKVGIQFVDFSVEDPLGNISGVRYFGDEFNGQASSQIYLDNAQVEEGKTYIFSFWVRAVLDTITIFPGLSSNNNENLNWKEWADIDTKWKRVWIKKTFEEVQDNPRSYISTSTIEPIYVWGVQLEEVFIEKDTPADYQPTDGSPIQVWLVAESSNWFWDKAEMAHDNNQVYRIQAILPRGRYAYRFQVGDQLILDSQASKKGMNNNKEEVSILEVGLKPKWNLGLEYSDPAIASDFSYKRISSNLRFVVPISYREILFFRIINGWVSEGAPNQRNFFLGNVGSLRGYGVKEFSGEQVMLLNMEYHVNIAHWIGKILTKEQAISDRAEYSRLEIPKDIFTIGDKTYLLGLNFKPFVFFDLGIIGTSLNKENTHKSAGIGLEFIGIRIMAAKRLEHEENSWSVLFDFGGFFNRWEYLP